MRSSRAVAGLGRRPREPALDMQESPTGLCGVIAPPPGISREICGDAVGIVTNQRLNIQLDRGGVSRTVAEPQVDGRSQAVVLSEVACGCTRAGPPPPGSERLRPASLAPAGRHFSDPLTADAGGERGPRGSPSRSLRPWNGRCHTRPRRGTEGTRPHDQQVLPGRLTEPLKSQVRHQATS